MFKILIVRNDFIEEVFVYVINILYFFVVLKLSLVLVFRNIFVVKKIIYFVLDIILLVMLCFYMWKSVIYIKLINWFIEIVDNFGL